MMEDTLALPHGFSPLSRKYVLRDRNGQSLGRRKMVRELVDNGEREKAFPLRTTTQRLSTSSKKFVLTE